MKIHLADRQKALPLSKPIVRKIVRTVLTFLNSEHTEISLYFITDREIAQMHAQFFDDPTPTDCISFPIDHEHLGEIFVSTETALRYGAKHKIDPYDETTLYIIHGILHCLGFDDLDPKSKKTMRKMEKRCMAHLKEHNLSLTP